MDIAIRKLEQVRPLSSEDKAALRGAFSILTEVRAGEDLLHYGDRPTSVSACLRGVLCRYKTMSSGARQIVSFVMPGDVFDLHSFTLGALDHNVAALTRTIVATAPHAAVLSLVKSRPNLSVLLWREAVVEAAVLREWVVNCGRRSAYARIAHLFCELYARSEAVGLAKDGECALPLTQTILSDATGLSVVHVNRVLQQLRGENLISLKAGQLTIHDAAALADAADFDPVYLHLREAPDLRPETARDILLSGVL